MKIIDPSTLMNKDAFTIDDVCYLILKNYGYVVGLSGSGCHCKFFAIEFVKLEGELSHFRLRETATITKDLKNTLINDEAKFRSPSDAYISFMITHQKDRHKQSPYRVVPASQH